MNKDKKLFDDFPPIATEKWEEVIQKDLKGADYERKLIWRTNDGINVRPYYRNEDLSQLEYINAQPAEFPYSRGNKTDNNEWEIRLDILVNDVEDANKKALNAINKGATSLGFVLHKELTATEMSGLLKDIELDCIEVNFDACCNEPVLIPLYIAEVKKRGFDISKMKGAFNFDPLGCLIKNGNYCFPSEDVAFEHLTESLNTLSEVFPNYKAIAVNGKYLHNAGATIVQELAYSFSAAVEYLDKLTDRGVDIDKAAQRIKFNFAVGSSYFMEIAKLRAARMVWANIIKAYKNKEKASEMMYIHAETSRWNKTIYDPYVNMLRTTTEAMSSVIAGVDSLTVIPFDENFRTPSKFSERIARNQQILLKEESYMDKAIDPAAGSYYIEKLTESITVEVWNLFKAAEENGGFLQTVKKGKLQDEIEAAAQKRNMNIALRREVLLGTNQYPNSSENVKSDIEKSTESKACNCSCNEENNEVRKLKIYRGAEAFEQIRLKTENAQITPNVFMFTYGNLAMRKARAMFSSNFFACAGFDIIDNNGFKSIEDGIDAAKKSEAEIVVLCSSDEEYADIAIPVFEQLNENAIVVLAGYPKDLISKLQKAGMEHFIHIKSNVLETLQEFQRKLGID